MNLSLAANEEVILTVRRHWFIFLEKLILEAGTFFILAGGLIAVERTFHTNSFDQLLIIFLAGLGLMFWSAISVSWTNYYLDAWVVTNQRLFDIEQHFLFTRDISEFRLDKVQDITVLVRGIIPTLLDFGNIHVQTAGRSREFILKQIPHPYAIRDRIARAVDDAHLEVLPLTHV